MKAAMLADDRKMVWREVPDPVLPRGHVQIAPAYVGLCGTDKHIYRGEFPSRVTYPRILGHEFSGRVVDVGEGVRGLDIGLPVAVDPIVWCERCPACLEGRMNACAVLRLYGIDLDGALCESIVVPAAKVFPVPEGLSLRDAAVIELFAVACHAIRKAAILPGDQVLVLGAGRLGLCLLSVLCCTAAARVIVVDPSPHRLELAKRLGAATVIDPRAQDPVDVVRDLTHGRGVDKAFEAVGHAQAIEGRDAPVAQAMAAIRSAGRVIVMGQGDDPVSLLWKPFVFKEADLITSRVTLGEFPRAMALAEQGRIVPAHIITHVFPFDQVTSAFELLDADDPTAVKIVVRMGDED